MNPWLWLSAAVLGADQVTKYAAEAWLTLHQPVNVLPGFNLTLTYNPGAAFSLLSEAGGWQRWLFAAVAVIAGGIIWVWLHRLPRTDRITAAALALVLGGAAGNLWDRLVPSRGQVVDFIDLYAGAWHWPAFNVADSGIVVGVGLLIVSSLTATDADKAAER